MLRTRLLLTTLVLLTGVPRLFADSVVVFNEVMYHPSTNEANLEWVELQNQHSVDVDLSHWSLEGGVHYEFPEGTVIRGGGYRVVAGNPAALAALTGLTNVLGPFTGRLSNAGDRLELRNNNRRLMDVLAYGVDGDWPVAADGAGPSLARRNTDLATGDPASWRESLEPGGTPGAANFQAPGPAYDTRPLRDLAASWRYRATGVDPGAGWTDPAFDDSSWSAGDAPFVLGDLSLPVAAGTPLPSGPVTYYFRGQFVFEGDASLQRFQLSPLINDGAVIYLNGVELHRYNLPDGPIGPDTPALAEAAKSVAVVPVLRPAAGLHPGTNLLAVELHQAAKSRGYAGVVAQSAPSAYWRWSETNGTGHDWALAFGAQDGQFAGLNPTNRVQAGPRPSDLVGGKALSGFEDDNNAARYQGNLDGGNDVFLVPDGPAVNFAADPRFSIECWVNGPATQETGAALCAHGTGGGGEQYALDIVSGKFRFYAWPGTPGGKPVTLSASVGPDGTWQHVVAVMDLPGGVMKIYVNGVERGSTVPPPAVASASHALSVGARQSGTGDYDLNFKGVIDELALYPRALGAAEIQRHYNAAFGSVEAPSIDTTTAAFALGVAGVQMADAPPERPLVFNELSGTAQPPVWVELLNTGADPIELAGIEIADLDGGAPGDVLPSGLLGPGERHVVTQAELGFKPKSGDRLVLFRPGRAGVLDAVRMGSRATARFPDGGPRWAYPSVATPGGPNEITRRDELVINEIMYHPKLVAALPAVVTNRVLVPATQTWAVNGRAEDLGVLWRDPSFNDGDWVRSPAPFTAPATLTIPIPKGTVLSLTNAQGVRVTTYYFRTTFNLDQDPAGWNLQGRLLVDDGAVVYLNGQEVLRWNLPVTNILAGTFASTNVTGLVLSDPVLLPSSMLRAGANSLAVEVHQVSATSSDMALALELSLARELSPAVPASAPRTSWVEIFNRSGHPVPLDGWQLAGGISFPFPAGKSLAAGGYLVVAEDPSTLTALHPDIDIVGPYGGQLSHGGEVLRLVDPAGNVANEVHYHDGGWWPEYADGGGSSLELMDPRSDNTGPGAWAASDESAGSEWRTYRWRGPAQPSQPDEPTLWHELELCLLEGAGEALVDDISVVESPGGTARQLIQNGGFNDGTPAHWRFLGNHRTSRVERDPGDPSNFVLHLVSSGPGEYQGNQIETTLTNNAAVVSGREYEISFRARWIAGASRLNARLYFNQLPASFPLTRTPLGGTPGRANSRAVANLGPTFSELSQAPVVPAPDEPVRIRVHASDPDGVRGVVLHYRVDGAPWQEMPMSPAGDGSWYEGGIPGQPAATLVQFYLEGTDTRGATALFPRNGPDSRALYRVRDDLVIPSGIRPFRMLMTAADAAYMHTGTNTLSNELLGGTVVYDDREIYYDVGIRLKGSFVGRNVARVGFHVAFQPDRPFRGVHGSISVDRSQHAQVGGVYEIISKHIAYHAGGIPDMQDDIAYCVAPIASYNVICSLRLAGFDPDWLDAQFDQGSAGSMFEVEVLRWNLATVDGRPESPKQVGNESGGTGYDNLEVTDYGNNPEAYRWFLLLVNNRESDDYTRGLAWCKALGASSTTFESLASQALDVDQFLRVMAFESLVGPADAYYTGANIHNFRVYARPSDGRMLYMPWDWDSVFQLDPGASILGGGNIARLLNKADWKRRYLNHLYDIVGTTFNASYMQSWTKHYGLLAQQDLSPVQTYIGSRAASVLSQLPTKTPFAITSNGGADIDTTNAVFTLVGTAPISVRALRVNGVEYPVTWTNNTNWVLSLPLAPGVNPVTVQGWDQRGQPVAAAADSLTITNRGAGGLFPVVVNEWMADNGAPYGFEGPAAGQYADWFELYNPNPVTVDLSGYTVTDDLALPRKARIPDGVTIGARGFLLVWADNTTSVSPAGELHAGFQLSAGGEAIGLFSPDGIRQHAIVFGAQVRNVSQGLYPDGNTNQIVSMPLWTPRAPNRPTSDAAPAITAIEVTPDGHLALTFSSIPGGTCRIESRDAVDSAAWITAGRVSLTTRVQRWEDPALPDRRRFYRVVLE